MLYYTGNMKKSLSPKKKATSLEHIKSDFITVASHQLRTPISAIRWSLDTLLQNRVGQLTEKQRQVVNEAYHNNTLMVKIVNDLLRVARIEEKGVNPVPELVNVRAMTDEIIKRHAIFAKASNTTVSVKADRALPKAYIDPLNLEVILDVLIDNAIRYTKARGKVIIEFKKVNGFLSVQVHDNGIGIPSKQHHLVFSKFFRGENASTVQTEGLGLDLYITKRIVEAAGGSINFRSVAGKGSTFIINVPVDQKQYERAAIQEYQQDNFERLKKEREFVSITVHELKAPLGTSKWSLELLLGKRSGPLTADQVELIERVYRGNERLLVLVRDLLNLSKLQEGKFEIAPIATSLDQLITDVVQSFSDEARQKSVRLVVPASKKLPKVLADPNRIGQVLTNLVSNAVKYTPQNGSVTITVQKMSGQSLEKLNATLTTADVGFTSHRKGYLVVAVHDTGIGISQEDQRKLFTRFFRSKKVLITKAEGTGLGLYITKSIVNLHRGDIWFHSTLRKGSTFFFSLPIYE